MDCRRHIASYARYVSANNTFVNICIKLLCYVISAGNGNNVGYRRHIMVVIVLQYVSSNCRYGSAYMSLFCYFIRSHGYNLG